MNLKILCKKTNKTFTEFKQQPVYWSADTIPVCPRCGISAYDAEYYEANHEMKQPKTTLILEQQDD